MVRRTLVVACVLSALAFTGAISARIAVRAAEAAGAGVDGVAVPPEQFRQVRARVTF